MLFEIVTTVGFTLATILTLAAFTQEANRRRAAARRRAR